MDILLSILALLFILIGILGCILPILPGIVLSYAGLVCAHFCSHSNISLTYLLVMLGVTVVASLIDYILPVYLTKLSGGSKAGQIGATVGVIAGLLFGGIPGAILGPLFGAMIGEYLHDSSDTTRVLKVGLGTFASFIIGTGLKIIIAGVMLIKVLSDIWPAIKAMFA